MGRPSYSALCIGNAFGNAALLLASGEKGMRSALPNARIMTSPPRINRNFGRLVNQEILTNQLNATHDQFVEVLSEMTGRHINEIKRAISRNKYYTTQKAIEFGIIDRILDPDARLRLNLKSYMRKKKRIFEFK